MSNELWLPIEGWPDYEVSNKGRVRSKKPRYKKSDGILTPVALKHKYLKVTLCDGPKLRKDLLVHRIVAFAFLGSPPTSLHEINHKDCDRQFNAVHNLEWVTKSENSIHAVKYGIKVPPPLRCPEKMAHGEQHGQSKLTLLNVLEIRESKESNSVLATRLGVKVNTISRVRNHNSWKRN